MDMDVMRSSQGLGPALINSHRRPQGPSAWVGAIPDVHASPAGRPFGRLSIFVLSVWFGLSVGLLELALTLAQKPLQDPSPGFFRMNRQIVWTIPLFNLALFCGVGLALVLVMRIWPRRGLRLSLAVIGLLAMFTLVLTCRRLNGLACLILACGLTYRLTKRIGTNLAGFRRLVRWSLPVLVAGVAGLVGVSLGGQILREQWALSTLPVPRVDAPNVLLVVLDTVRADRLSLYGYPRETSPNLARLARHGVTFERARSTAPWTLPSHASMMTGRWPHQLSARLHGPLDATYPTLAESLSAHGYITAGFIANSSYCSAETGLARGFAHYEDHDLSPGGFLRTTALGRRVVWQALVYASQWFGGDLRPEPMKTAERVSTDLLAWLDRQEEPRPFFAFLNFIDAHTPYLPPASFGRHFGLKPESADDLATIDRWFTLDKTKVAPRDIQLAGDAYDDCIAYLDEQLGRMFDELDRRGLTSNTLIIVTADHGEHLGEHDLFGHASSLYDPEIHVPLIVVSPDNPQAGRTIAEPVSLRDLPSTIADLVGLGGSATFPGRSLARMWKDNGEVDPTPILSEVDGPAKSTPNLGRSPAFRGPMKAVAIGREVYLRNADGAEEFYDLATDPLQMRNLIHKPEVLARLGSFRITLDRLTRDDTRPVAWRNTAGPRQQLGRLIVPGTITK